MIDSKRAQLSFEYILLLSFVLILFLITGTLIVSSVERAKNIESESVYIAKNIKSEIIIASLSDSDFRTMIDLTDLKNKKGIYIDIYSEPDNIIILKKFDQKTNSFVIVTREFLPRLNFSDVKNYTGETGRIIIGKKDEKINIFK